MRSFVAFELVDGAVGVLAEVEPEVLIAVAGFAEVHAEGLACDAVPLFGTGPHALGPMPFMF
jgi:hypothetical protein